MPRHPDYQRIQEVLAGPVADWRRLIADYTGLALGVAFRHLRDEDLARDTVVDVFAQLYRGKLARFDGRSAFGTWLVLLVRHAAIDRLRREQGRPRLPACIARRPERDQRIFELFFMQGWPPEAVHERMLMEDAKLDCDTFWSLVDEMQAELDERSLRRLRFDRHAHRLGHPSGRWLEYAEHWQQEASDHLAEASPDRQLIAAEAAAAVTRMRAAVADLDEDERRALDLRFAHSLSAREIAREMRLDGQRQAFTVIERALRKLRQTLIPAAERPRLARVPLELEAER